MVTAWPSDEELIELIPTVMTYADDEFDPMIRDQALKLYLFLPVTYRSLMNRSSLEALLGDARQAVGRDPRTGEIVKSEHTRSWLGAMGYLALIDQMSSMFELPAGDGSAFERLLAWEGLLMADEATALYALRCAFVHNYGLLNDRRQVADRHLADVDLTEAQARKRVRKMTLTHRFELNIGDSTVVSLSDRRFSYDTDPRVLPPTRVDLSALSDHCERLVDGVRSRYLDGTGMTMKADMELSAFVSSFFFRHGVF